MPRCMTHVSPCGLFAIEQQEDRRRNTEKEEEEAEKKYYTRLDRCLEVLKIVVYLLGRCWFFFLSLLHFTCVVFFFGCLSVLLYAVFFFILVVSYSSVGSGRMTVVCKVQREGITIESNSYERNVFACVHSVTECILPFSCVLCVWYVCTNISIYCALYLIAIANGRPIFDLSNGADAFYTNTTHVYINVSI